MRDICLNLLLLTALSAQAATAPGHVSVGEIYRAYESETELTEVQRTYILGVLATAVNVNNMAWRHQDRGLFCLPDHQSITDLTKNVVLRQIGSEHGWIYTNQESVSRVIIDGLTSQYPCTDAEVAKFKKKGEEFMEILFGTETDETDH